MSRKPRTTDEGGTVIELVNTSVLIPRDVQRRIRMLAAENERTMGAEIRAALDAHIGTKEAA